MRCSVAGYPVQGASLWRVGGFQPLFVWDFTQQSPGALVLPTGLTFARASSGHTVQTSESALVTAGITSNDVGRIGRLSSAQSYGLYVEPSRTNLIGSSRSPQSLPSGSWASTTTGQSDAAGGSAAVRVQSNSGATGRYVQSGTLSGSYTGSAWYAKGSGSGAYQMTIGNTTTHAQGGTASATWARVVLTHVVPTETLYCLPNDGQNQSASGGVAAGARDALVDFMQLEAGKYPTSAILTSVGATRSGERLSIDSTRAAASVVSGRLGVYLRFRALAASSELGSGEGTLLAWATGSVVVDPTSTYLKAIDGALYSQTANAAISWARGDLLEFVVEVGAGTTALRWRVNGGATNASVFSTRDDALAALSLSAGLDVCNTAAAGQMPSIVERLSTFVPGRALF